MRNFTTKQLQLALIELYKSNYDEAYRLCFGLLEAKMGEDAFDVFLDEQGF